MNNRSKLEEALYSANFKEVQFLIDKGSEFTQDLKNKGLHIAISKGGNSPIKNNHNNIAKFLIDNGADINQKDKDGNTLLLQKITSRNFNYMDIKFLLDNGADINIKNNDKQTVLHFIYKLNDLNLINDLMREKSEINIKDKDGNTPLIYASKYNNYKVVKLLIDNGADITITNKNEENALMSLSNSRYFINEKEILDIISISLKKGIDINTKYKNGETILMRFLLLDRLRDFLIDNGADVNVKSNTNETLLMIASRNHNNEIVKLLIQKGLQINVQDNKGETALLKACKVYANPIAGETPKDMYIHDTLITLLKVKADIKIKDNEGNTAFMLAVKNNLADAIKLFIDYGVDIKKENIDIQLLFVKSLWHNDNFELSDYLLDKGFVDINTENTQGNTPLLSVIDDYTNFYNFKIIEYLIDKGANLNIANKFGFTPLMLVVKDREDNENDIILYMIKKGAKINISRKDELITPLTLALINKRENAYRILKEKNADTLMALKYLLANDLYFEKEYFEEKLNDLLPCEMTDNTALLLLQSWSYFDKRIDVDKIDKCILLIEKLKIKFKEDEYGYIDFTLADNGNLKKINDALLNNLHSINSITFEDVLGEFIDFPNYLLSKILKKFSSDERLKYTNHPLDEKLDYATLIKSFKVSFEEISSNLKILSPTLYKSINDLLFSRDEDIQGWSSTLIKNEIEQGKLSSNLINDLQEKFKNLIVVKDENKLSLLDRFDNIIEELDLKIKIDLNYLGENPIDKFFTDTKRFEQAVKIIFKDINEHIRENSQGVIVEADEIQIKEIDMLEIKIIHIKSSSSQNSNKLEETLHKNGGNFQSIYKNLISLCDWSVDTLCNDGRYKIDYLYPNIDNNKPHCTKIEDSIRGFTHILRFYK